MEQWVEKDSEVKSRLKVNEFCDYLVISANGHKIEGWPHMCPYLSSLPSIIFIHCFLQKGAHLVQRLSYLSLCQAMCQVDTGEIEITILSKCLLREWSNSFVPKKTKTEKLGTVSFRKTGAVERASPSEASFPFWPCLRPGLCPPGLSLGSSCSEKVPSPQTAARPCPSGGIVTNTANEFWNW